jgi:iron complex outermembrane receptor protein
MSRQNYLYAGLCAIMVQAMFPATAWAADNADADADRNADIIVTARKQQESILKVPVVETVITSEALGTYQINNLQDITTKIPGLVSGNAVLAIGEQMSLRGVGSNSLDQGVDQSVSLNIDGLQLTHGLAFRAASFDLAQVEVLKGPQALYFGKNSTAGVISFRSADPGNALEVKGKAGYEFEAREARAEFIVSSPLSETLGVRLAALYTNSDGIFRNKATALPGSGAANPTQKRLGGGESYLLRGTLLWKPDADLTVRLKANFTQDKMNSGGLNTLAACPDGKAIPTGIPVTLFHPNEDCQFNKDVYIVDFDPASWANIRNNGVPFLNLRQYFGTLDIAYDVSPEISISSVTGYYNAKADTMINGTFAGYGPPFYFADNIFKRREWTQEFRIESDFADSPVNFTAGGFYQDGKLSNDFTLGGRTGPLLKGLSTIKIESLSAFGQLRWKLVDTLELAGGVRWTHEKRNLTVFNRVANAAVALAPGSDKLDSKNWSPEFTITYTPTDDFTVFAALKQAYKSGSFNIVIPASTGQDKHFGDEMVRGGEVGIKSRLMDRSLSLNLAGYYYRYKGLQTGVNEPAQNGLPVLRTLNAGKAEVYGVDFDMRYRPPSIDGLTLNLALNWNKTKFLELNNVPCYGGQMVSQGCNQFWAALPATGTGLTQTNPGPGAVVDPSGRTALLGRYSSQNLAGVPFVRAPEWQVNFGFDYEMSLGGGLRLVFANDNQYSSSFLTILGNPAVRPSTVQRAALKMDLNLSLYGPDDRWSVGVYGKNLSDQLRPGYCSSLNYPGGQSIGTPLAGGTARNASGEDEIGCSFASGRSIGVWFGFKF